MRTMRTDLEGRSMVKFVRVGARRMLLAVACIAAPSISAAQTTPTVPPLSMHPNVFYGEVPAGGENAPVLVFVHGPGANASSWWLPANSMYPAAFNAGYRTAFVGLNTDNTPDKDGILANQYVLRTALPAITVHFNVPSVYIIAHSKGGIDVQAAMLDPGFAFYVKAVFTIATPHQGTEFADWAFTVGAPWLSPLGVLTPALLSMQTAWMTNFRNLADPVSMVSGVPYFTITADTHTTPPNPVLAFFGPIIGALTGQPNDGIVAVPRTKLLASYAHDLGTVPVNHFAAQLDITFPRINAQIQSLEGTTGFRRIASGGFSVDEFGNPLPGDRQNSFPWSTQWFQGKLYVGTGRAFLCVVTQTNDVALGEHNYPPPYQNVECTPDPTDLPLRAEIWRYTPETSVWERVYQSPQDVPIEFDEQGNPTKFTARDIAFRGMALFKENDAAGTERLYIGGISASSLYENLPAYVDPQARRFPPPRIIWTEDGTTWNAVPQTPGTFLGDIGIQTEAVNKRGFRSFVTLRDSQGVNRLFVTVSDLRGVGRTIMSANPSAGDNAWRQVSPDAALLPIFTLYVYRNEIYATVGDTGYPNGYAVFKTDGQTPDPTDPTKFLFTPVVEGDGIQIQRPLGAISMQEFQGSLYVGSDRPTELIRINQDGSWDLIVGPPRWTLSGQKRPLSGLGKGFNSLFNGHFYTMAVHNGELYVGTWDWSQNMIGTPLDGLFNQSYGFDFFKTRDGIYWNVISRTGLGDHLNSSVRNLEATPAGLFVAATNPYFGLQMFRDQPVTSQVSAPSRLLALTSNVGSPGVVLSWTEAAGAVRYHVFRADANRLNQVLPGDADVPLTDGSTLTVDEIKDPTTDPACRTEVGELGGCGIVDAVKTNSEMTKLFRWIGSTAELSFTDTTALASAPALYYVIAENARGRMSPPTNVVSGPSAAETPTVARLGAEILRLRPLLDAPVSAELTTTLGVLTTALSEGRFADARAALSAIESGLDALQGAAGAEARAAAVAQVADSLSRYVTLAESGRIAPAVTIPLLLEGTAAAQRAARTTQ